MSNKLSRMYYGFSAFVLVNLPSAVWADVPDEPEILKNSVDLDATHVIIIIAIALILTTSGVLHFIHKHYSIPQTCAEAEQ